MESGRGTGWSLSTSPAKGKLDSCSVLPSLRQLEEFGGQRRGPLVKVFQHKDLVVTTENSLGKGRGDLANLGRRAWSLWLMEECQGPGAQRL